MKKVFIWIVVVFCVLVMFGFGCYFFKEQFLEKEIEGYPDYYKELVEGCELVGSYGCCMESVRRMAEGDWELSPEDGCPENYKWNMLKCVDSYKWCEKDLEGSCVLYGGNWVNEFLECEGLSEENCSNIGGEYFECESPCRYNSRTDGCIALCVEVCKFGKG